MSKIDYDLNEIRGVVFDVDGVLSPTVIPMGHDGIPQRMANLKDGYALQLAVKAGLKIAIITGADTAAVAGRFNALGINDVYLKASKKLDILNEWMAVNDLEPRQVAYCGDDIPDYTCICAVGLPVAPRDAAVEIRNAARYVTEACGGYGVARELLEEVLKAQGHWPLDVTANGR